MKLTKFNLISRCEVLILHFCVFENISARNTRVNPWLPEAVRHLIPTSKPWVDIQVVLLDMNDQNSDLEGGITRDVINILH